MSVSGNCAKPQCRQTRLVLFAAELSKAGSVRYPRS